MEENTTNELLKAVKPLVNKELAKRRDDSKKITDVVSGAKKIMLYSPTVSKDGSRNRQTNYNITFDQLRQFGMSYPIARACINYRISQITQLAWAVAPKELVEDDDEVEAAKKKSEKIAERLKFPTSDKSLTFRGFLTKILEDLLVLDAATIERQFNFGNKVTGWRPFDAGSIELLLMPDGSTPTPPTPAYQQKIDGKITAQLTTDEMYYKMIHPRTNTPYGLSPLETLVVTVTTALKLQTFNLSYLCYDDQTEILTKDGWKFFNKLDDNDVVATRSKDAKFEWQKPLSRHEFDYDDDLIRFKSSTVDLFVTPNHRMLVDYRDSGGKFTSKGLIKRADWFIENKKSKTQNYLAPTKSDWNGEDIDVFNVPKYVVHKGKASYTMPKVSVNANDWLAFFGIYLAEGHCRATNKQSRHTVYISQQRTSRHWEEINNLLARLPFNFNYIDTNGVWECSDARLWTYLRKFGHSYNKYIPTYIKNFNKDLLNILWSWMFKGDGHHSDNMMVYSTVSKRMADDVQEILQKIGFDPRVTKVHQKPGNVINGKVVKTTVPIYKIFARVSDHRSLSCASHKHYKGKVSSVKVPNGIVYVRRNGVAIWCGNTEGNIPEGFVQLPKDIISNPEQLAEWQSSWDAIFSGDARYQRKLKFLPEGMKYEPTAKQDDMNFERFEKWLLLNTASVFQVPPQSIGFDFDSNKAIAETQYEVGRERGLLPLTQFVKEFMDEIIHKDLKEKDFEFIFLNLNPTNKLEEAKVFDILVRTGAMSIDEFRVGEGLRPIGVENYIMTPIGPIFVQDLVEQSERGLDPAMPYTQTASPLKDGTSASSSPKTTNPETMRDQKREAATGISSGSQGKGDKSKVSQKAEMMQELKKWKKVAKNDIKIGRDKRSFYSEHLNYRTQELIKMGLKKAQSSDDVNKVFEPFMKLDTDHLSDLKELYGRISNIIKS